MGSSILSHIASSPYLLAGSVLISVWFYSSAAQSQSFIYGRFERVRGPPLGGEPVYALVEDGYNKIIKLTQKPFVVKWWAKDYIILPPKYLSDLKRASWRHLSFFQNISDALFLHTTVGDLYTAHTSERMVDVVKRGINTRLPQLTPIMLDEINYAFEKELGDFIGWKEITAMAFFSSVAHRTATRVLIGEELCRNEEFLKLSSDFLNSIFVTALVIVKLPLGPFRNLLAWPISLLHRWKLQSCARILLPIVKKRIEDRKITGSDRAKKLDAIEWTLDLVLDSSPHNSPERITDELLHALWAGSSAPGGMMTEVVYQLLLNSQYLQPLKEEALAAVKESGWSEKMLNSLHFQDSLIREANRLYPTGSVTCSRTVVGQPFQFSDGLTLPVGTRFGFPIKALQRDPDNFNNPNEFDGFRFAKQNTNEEQFVENTRVWGAASMGTTNLAWGFGNHICPGRFFAVREMKIVLTKLLLEFDFKWENPGNSRPPPVHVEGQFVPNMTQKIALKRSTENGMSSQIS